MELEPEISLVLLLARLDLSREQAARIRELGRTVDWGKVEQLAEQHFILPIAYRHLRGGAQGAAPQGVIESMRRKALLTSAMSLHMASAQRCFIQAVIKPGGFEHVFFKGLTFAELYYGGAGLRPFRDIDVLTPRRHRMKLLRAAAAAGYRIPEKNGRPLSSELNALHNHYPVVMLASPENVNIEVHHSLDYGNGLFDTSSVLRSSITYQSQGVPIRTLPAALHFVYLCVHHTRHRWAHLHWLTDLDAIIRHPSFNLEEARSEARTRRLRATLEASLDLHEVCGRAEPIDPEKIANSHVGDLLAGCLTSLRGGKAAEFAARLDNVTPDLAFPWQVEPGAARPRPSLKKNKIVFYFWPQITDYAAMPLPAALHWLYFFTRPPRLIWKYLIRPRLLQRPR